MNSNIKNSKKVEGKMIDSLCISVPNKPEYVSVVRLTASAIASRMGFSFEEIEDIKVAIAEACTNVIKHGMCNKSENYEIDFVMEENKIIIDIIDKGTGFCFEDVLEPDLSCPKEGGLGIFIIKSLMDEVEIKSDLGKGTAIKMIKYLGDGI